LSIKVDRELLDTPEGCGLLAGCRHPRYRPFVWREPLQLSKPCHRIHQISPTL